MSKPENSAKAKKATPAEDKQIEKRWGKDLVAAGWTAIPNVLFEHSQDLELKHLDVVIILHLAGYWWHAGNDPYPTKDTLARKIGVTPRTIQRSIAGLEAKGYITRHARKSSVGGNLANSYSFDGIIQAATPFAKAAVSAREKSKALGNGRKTTKTPVALELVK